MEIKIQYSKRFLKHYRSRIAKNSKLDKRFKSRLQVFLKNPKESILRTHQLVGSKQGLYSFSITGDIRVIYRYIFPNTVEFLDIGTHNQVYN